MSARNGVSVEQPAVGKNGRRPRPAALVLRPATRSDLVPLSFFFDTLLRRDYFVRRGQLEEIVSGRHHQVYVAEIDSVLVGVAITTRGSRLINALVHPAYRGLGIGKALVKRSGASEVRAKLDMSTGDPRGFYRSMGFVSTGGRSGKRSIEVLRLANAHEANTPHQHAQKRRSVTGKPAGKNGRVSRKQKLRK